MALQSQRRPDVMFVDFPTARETRSAEFPTHLNFIYTQFNDKRLFKINTNEIVLVVGLIVIR